MAEIIGDDGFKARMPSIRIMVMAIINMITASGPLSQYRQSCFRQGRLIQLYRALEAT